MPRVVSLWLPVVAWAAVIFVLSSVPDLGTGLGGWDLLLRKKELLEQGPWAVAYAVTDELHQHFISGRVGAPVDVAIDALGVVVGVLVGRWWL